MPMDLVRSHRGVPGTDGVTFEAIEADEGKAAFLAELETELRSKGRWAQPVRRVWKPESNGERRPLGIPALRDRAAQSAVKRVVEPIFEADFCVSSYGFRPQPSAYDGQRGTPQRGVIPPLLANLSLHRLDRIWERHGLEDHRQARRVRYCDDLVLL